MREKFPEEMDSNQALKEIVNLELQLVRMDLYKEQIKNFGNKKSTEENPNYFEQILKEMKLKTQKLIKDQVKLASLNQQLELTNNETIEIIKNINELKGKRKIVNEKIEEQIMYNKQQQKILEEENEKLITTTATLEKLKLINGKGENEKIFNLLKRKESGGQIQILLNEPSSNEIKETGVTKNSENQIYLFSNCMEEANHKDIEIGPWSGPSFIDNDSQSELSLYELSQSRGTPSRGSPLNRQRKINTINFLKISKSKDPKPKHRVSLQFDRSRNLVEENEELLVKNQQLENRLNLVLKYRNGSEKNHKEIFKENEGIELKNFNESFGKFDEESNEISVPLIQKNFESISKKNKLNLKFKHLMGILLFFIICLQVYGLITRESIC